MAAMIWNLCEGRWICEKVSREDRDHRPHRHGLAPEAYLFCDEYEAAAPSPVMLPASLALQPARRMFHAIEISVDWTFVRADGHTATDNVLVCDAVDYPAAPHQPSVPGKGRRRRRAVTGKADAVPEVLLACLATVPTCPFCEEACGDEGGELGNDRRSLGAFVRGPRRAVGAHGRRRAAGAGARGHAAGPGARGQG